MKTSLLICATCLIVTGCSAQFRFPSLSSALSSLTGFGGGSGSQSSSNSGASSSSSQAAQSSPYSGLVRDYGRNLMMAMSSIYPTLFRPPQQQQQQQQPSQTASQSAFDQSFGGSQFGSQSLFPSQSAPSFSLGGSTFSITPSLPFGLGSGNSGQSQPGSHSPFSASFGSSINSPPSFGPLSSDPFMQNSLPSFAPASSYKAAFEAANGGPSSVNGAPSFGSISSAPSGLHTAASAPINNQALVPQPSNAQPISSYAPISNFNSQHDPSGSSNHMIGHPQQQHHQHHQQQAPMNQQSQIVSGPHHSAAPFSSGQASHSNQPGNQYAPHQYRPDMMSIAASAPVPSSNSYSNYGGIPSGSSSQQAPIPSSSYQQPSYR